MLYHESTLHSFGGGDGLTPDPSLPYHLWLTPVLGTQSFRAIEFSDMADKDRNTEKDTFLKSICKYYIISIRNNFFLYNSIVISLIRRIDTVNGFINIVLWYHLSRVIAWRYFLPPACYKEFELGLALLFKSNGFSSHLLTWTSVISN